MGFGETDNVPLLEVHDLRTTFFTDGGVVPAVDGVSLCIPCGRTVALVGESGCGKSVTALSLMRLIPQPPGRIVGGRVLLHAGQAADMSPRKGGDTSPLKEVAAAPRGGRKTPKNAASGRAHRVSQQADRGTVDLLTLSERRMRSVRGGQIAMIFQEPMTSLNPVFSIGEQIVEAIELHQRLRGKTAWAAAVDLLRRVGIAAPERRAHDYPHRLSGGMCQRVMIAMALACQPALLIADEPTTALDVTVQLQILDLLGALQESSGMSILLITHDLGVVAQLADYVYVMYAGRIVEHASVEDLFSGPLHPYTQGLLRCLPRLSDREDRLEVIPGNVPDPRSFPAGCRFHPRCVVSAQAARGALGETVRVDSAPFGCVLKRCVEYDPRDPAGVLQLRELRPGHFVACGEADVSPRVPRYRS